MPPAPAPHPVHGPMHPGRCVSARRHEGSDPGCPCWGRGGLQGRAGTRKAPRGLCSLMGHVLHADAAPHAHHEALHLTLVDAAGDAEMPVLAPRSAPRVGRRLQRGTLSAGATVPLPGTKSGVQIFPGLQPPSRGLSPAALITPVLTQYFWIWPSGSCSSPHLQQEGSEEGLRAPRGDAPGGSRRTPSPCPLGRAVKPTPSSSISPQGQEPLWDPGTKVCASIPAPLLSTECSPPLVAAAPVQPSSLLPSSLPLPAQRKVDAFPPP